jgi:hypothetical protein
VPPGLAHAEAVEFRQEKIPQRTKLSRTLNALLGLARAAFPDGRIDLPSQRQPNTPVLALPKLVAVGADT